MTKGYVVYANGNTYVEQAHLLALTLRRYNSNPISIITNSKLSSNQKKVFDQIIEIPWEDKKIDRFDTGNRWKVYHASPYDQTIVFDSDVLVLQNLDTFWKFLENYKIYFPSSVNTYRGNKVVSNYYRKAFAANKLPNIYSTVYYFCKGDYAHEFFKLVELISNNWELFYGQFCKEFYPKVPSMDITHSIASKILDIDTEITNIRTMFPNIVHMKTHCQEWKRPTESWQDKVGCYLNNEGHLKIGNYIQDCIFHYTEDSFVDPLFFEIFEEESN